MAHHSYERGSAAIEFAIILPIFLLVLFGIINYGILMYDQAVVTNAAREGARWAAIHTSAIYGTSCTNSYSLAPADPCQAAYSYAHNLLITFGASSSLTATYLASANFNSGTPQSVTVTYKYQGIGYYFGDLAEKEYSSKSVMLHE
jgi:Flp pilus assembly protein TadG